MHVLDRSTCIVRQFFKKTWHVIFSKRPHEYVGPFLVKIIPESYQSRVRNEFFTGKGPRGILADIIRAELNRQYYSSKTAEEIRKRDREVFWGATPGKRWHDFTRSKYDEEDPRNSEFLEPRRLLARQISDFLASSGEYRTLCEIGTGNGMLLHELSQRCPSIKRFIGVDLNKEQILENRRTYKGTELEFVHGEITDWIQHQCDGGTIFVAVETFEFFTQKELEELFHYIRDKVWPAAIAILALAESTARSEVASRPRGSIAFNHNYLHLLKQRDYRVFRHEIQHGSPYDAICLLAIAPSREG